MTGTCLPARHPARPADGKESGGVRRPSRPARRTATVRRTAAGNPTRPRQPRHRDRPARSKAVRSLPARLRPPSGAPRGAGRRQRLVENAQHLRDCGTEFADQRIALVEELCLRPAPGALEPDARPQVRIAPELPQAFKELGPADSRPSHRRTGVPAATATRQGGPGPDGGRRQMRNPHRPSRGRTRPGLASIVQAS